MGSTTTDEKSERKKETNELSKPSTTSTSLGMETLTTKQKDKTMNTDPTTTAQSTPKQPYAPPKATFVPLKLEERLLRCGKVQKLLSCKPFNIHFS